MNKIRSKFTDEKANFLLSQQSYIPFILSLLVSRDIETERKSSDDSSDEAKVKACIPLCSNLEVSDTLILFFREIPVELLF